MTQPDFNKNSTAEPLTSLIVRTKNRPCFLQEALQSICRQTYPNIEIVIVNDGGEDVSGVADSFTNQVSAIQLVQLTASLGRSGAANQGLSAANGEFIGFLDDDDLLEPNHVEELIRFAQHHAAQTVYSATRVISVDADGNNHDITVYSTSFSASHLLYENFIPIHSVLFRRELIADNTCFDTDFDFFEDWDFWLQLSRKTDFLHCPTITAIYRLHSHSSGVHQQANRDPYLHIYKKWLSAFTAEDFIALLEKTHQWHDDSIAALQQINYQRLNEIGNQHSYAQQIVQQRDAQLDYAQQIVQQRDAQLAEKNSELQKLKSTLMWRIYSRLAK
ncbi:glycosyltransferase family 2 protein [Candidatus Methylobacter oryzae]|uniref:Glycosyltransferase family 2 protein n=1 Tax=Candidatus Methylobacter oryzae TaxID=2497749 RepID=A0ABY3C7Y6_9GAMM|nr:glycosyltransferase family 2 protein [Candidatus Methylobacter oryzae]TRW92205.1 glycosyltransferase family 2 protein [Candidatus Methylobacter oryzae]